MASFDNGIRDSRSSLSKDCESRTSYVPETVLSVFSLTSHNDSEGDSIIPIIKTGKRRFQNPRSHS
jgi:hypothetical protein